jgi:excisionase family DNA binding protein
LGQVPTSAAPKLLGTNETATRLGVSVETLRRLVAAGSLPVVRFGPRSHLRFDPEDVSAFLRRSKLGGDRALALAVARGRDPEVGQSISAACADQGRRQ